MEQADCVSKGVTDAYGWWVNIHAGAENKTIRDNFGSRYSVGTQFKKTMPKGIINIPEPAAGN